MQGFTTATARSATAARRREGQATERRSPQEQDLRRRRRMAWALTLCSLIGFVGTAWDIQWHAAVGRDSFLTPPHLLIYAGIGVSGLLALAFVLAETVRYHRAAPSARPAGSARALWVFRAPLGAMMAGFGVLSSVIAAPLDTFWHQLYGIDVTLWAPFHVMGISGSIIVGLGTLYLFASAAPAAGAPEGRGWSAPELGFVLRAGLLLATALFLAIPALENQPYVGAMALHPLIVAFVLGAIVVATARTIGRPGAATLLGLMYGALLLLVNWLVPLAVATMVARQGAAYRASAPGFTVVTAAFPIWVIAPGLLVDALLLLARRRADQGAPAASPKLWVLAGALAGGCAAIIEPLWRRIALVGVVDAKSAALIAEQAAPSVLLVSALGALALGAAGALLGFGLGASLGSAKE